MTPLLDLLIGIVTGLAQVWGPGVPSPAHAGVWPLDPRPVVAAGFDPPDRAWGAGHRGVDLLGSAGQGVRTSLPGTVTFAAALAGRGVVVVDHGPVRTTYEPVRSSVHVGDLVGRGQRLGSLQRLSSHCFPRTCLHWGLIRDDTYLDPLTLVGAGPVRLLPLDEVGQPPGQWPGATPLVATAGSAAHAWVPAPSGWIGVPRPR